MLSAPRRSASLSRSQRRSPHEGERPDTSWNCKEGEESYAALELGWLKLCRALGTTPPSPEVARPRPPADSGGARHRTMGAADPGLRPRPVTP